MANNANTEATYGFSITVPKGGDKKLLIETLNNVKTSVTMHVSPQGNVALKSILHAVQFILNKRRKAFNDTGKAANGGVSKGARSVSHSDIAIALMLGQETERYSGYDCVTTALSEAETSTLAKNVLKAVHYGYPPTARGIEIACFFAFETWLEMNPITRKQFRVLKAQNEQSGTAGAKVTA